MKIKETKKLNSDDLKQIRNIIQKRVKTREDYLSFNLWYFNHFPIKGAICSIFTLPVEIIYQIKNTKDEKILKQIDELQKNNQQISNLKVGKIKCKI